MKKLFAILLTVVMVCSLSVTAFAAGAFIESPSYFEVPIIIDFENSSHECPAQLVIIPYSKRDTLSSEKREALVAAYDQIAGTKDITAFNADFKAATEKKGLVPAQLVVSDLFDLSYIACDLHSEHGGFTITLQPETLKDFVGLLHLKNGEWEYVSNAEVIEDGKQLKFYVEDLSPFAIVTKHDTPTTGDAGINPIWIVMMAASLAGLVVVHFVSKKANANEA